MSEIDTTLLDYNAEWREGDHEIVAQVVARHEREASLRAEIEQRYGKYVADVHRVMGEACCTLSERDWMIEMWAKERYERQQEIERLQQATPDLPKTVRLESEGE